MLLSPMTEKVTLSSSNSSSRWHVSDFSGTRTQRYTGFFSSTWHCSTHFFPLAPLSPLPTSSPRVAYTSNKMSHPFSNGMFNFNIRPRLQFETSSTISLPLTRNDSIEIINARAIQNGVDLGEAKAAEAVAVAKSVGLPRLHLHT
jgi:hypothetical protein